MTTCILLDYDLQGIECPGCDNWGELTGNDPRRRSEEFGFRFNSESPAEDFTCLDCGSAAKDRYYRITGYDAHDDPELEDITDEIVAFFDR